MKSLFPTLHEYKHDINSQTEKKKKTSDLKKRLIKTHVDTKNDKTNPTNDTTEQTLTLI